MENISAVTSFILLAYTELEDHKYLFFTGFLLLYILILLVNSVLIFVICNEKSLHEPMYLFICNLSVNAIYSSTVFLSSILGHLSSQNYEISLAHCLLQTYCIYLSGIAELTILAVMAYDRYVAICHPLHYHLLMSHRKAYTAIVLSWVIPCLYFSLYFISIARLSFCEKHIDKLLCLASDLQEMSCFDTTVEKLFGMVLILVCPGIPFVMILFSYAQILSICIFASRETQVKALQTCTPHLLAVIYYNVGALVEVTHSTSVLNQVPHKARFFIALCFYITPPLFNPVIYGISIQAVRIQLFKLLTGNKK